MRSSTAVDVDVAPARAPRRRLAFLLGPAFVAAIAYVDPGNVAANLTAGARYGYLLLWVLVVANAMAVLVQYQSAKLGLVTGQSLPGLLGQRLRRGPRLAFWAQAELVAAATDIAEVVGGAIALNLLFGLPLPLGGLIVGIVSLALLLVQNRYGQSRFELVIVGLLAIISVGFLAGLFVVPPDARGVLSGLVPRFDGPGSVLLAASMLGATVMPHAIYVHSALARDRHGSAPTDSALSSSVSAGSSSSLSTGSSSSVATALSPSPSSTRSPLGALLPLLSRSSVPSGSPEVELPARGAPSVGAEVRYDIPRLLRATRWDVGFALAIAGVVNIGLLLLAASGLRGAAGTDSIPGAYDAIVAALGVGIGIAFAIGLLASGLASTSVGAYAGATIMEGLLRRRVPLVLRRSVTLIPALALLAFGADPTWTLVISQVILSFGIPFAVIPLVRLTRSRAVMGVYRNGLRLHATLLLVVALVVTLNLTLIVLLALG
ncbi:Nramp family divalent metal transporter [Cellulomonas sp. URHD0024]|uniref:Nramp family divalent metal transporter n=1 Tax=Cellulomonas sp. URHD0024 TaxID=1302620 RepID=UPI0003F911AA|nr:Nramp family divalent metal transporter [Cellulomonas sp. URHD0024]